MGRLFGTDGIRGRAFGDLLTADLTRRVAAGAAAELLAGQDRPVVAIGRDTRPSGPALQDAAVAGFTAAGCDVLLLGVVPTPAVAYAAQHHAALGLMISASHNPAPDNGLKLFAAGGGKLTDAQEDAVEARLAAPDGPARRGRVLPDEAATPVTEGYLGHLVATAGPLAGLHVVVDGAQGAASELGPEAYTAAGARVTAVHCAGDGARINAGCGATEPAALAAAVREHRADLGVAHDGDADRCVVVDHTGRVLGGDQVLGLLAVARRERGAPASDALVATVMSNLGLELAMGDRGIEVVRSAVGDRYVLAAMLERDLLLGGEQSGHVVLREHAPTGDGLLTALQVMDRVARTGRPVGELADVVRLLPQVLVNVPAARERAAAPEVLAAVAEAEAELAGTGRVLLRASGTEPLVRVMVEAGTEAAARAVAGRLAALVAG